MYQFIPPVAYQQPFSERSPLWSRITLSVPYTVVKLTSGAYVQELEHNPDREGIAVVYEGGHVFLVTDAEGEALIAAGYTATPIEVSADGYTASSLQETGPGMVPTPGYAEVEATSVTDLLNGYLNVT